MPPTSWRVNSYGYPNPFTTDNGRNAWKMFESFTEASSYRALKADWEQRPRPVTANGVESWKANFEECGLLYVPYGKDDVIITPAGSQLLDAADRMDEREFAWIGTNLLLRYALRGKGGRSRREPPFGDSDILPYWLVLASILDLDGLWQSELFRILGAVFYRSDVNAAVESIREARSGQLRLNSLPDLATRGAGYNSLNQVAVKAGLNQMTLRKQTLESPYGRATEPFWSLDTELRNIVELALGGFIEAGCQDDYRPAWTDRMPAAPYIETEVEYFEFVGAPCSRVSDVVQSRRDQASVVVVDGLGCVHLVSLGGEYLRTEDLTVEGPIYGLCSLAIGGRVILSDDEGYTYIVLDKQIIAGGKVRVKLRRGRPLLDASYVRTLFSG